jgi:hypothetical protein
MDFDWYEEVSKETPLTQGDILYDFPLPVIVENEDYPFFKAGVGFFDVILMTQACDLEQGKIDQLSFCVIEPLNDIIAGMMRNEMGPDLDLNNLSANQKKRPPKLLEELKKGQHLNFHLLNRNISGGNDTTIDMDYKVVLLKDTFKMPFIAAQLNLANYTKPSRLRLLPPYREHLAQAYANTYSRIGLPMDINTKEIELNLQ